MTPGNVIIYVVGHDGIVNERCFYVTNGSNTEIVVQKFRDGFGRGILVTKLDRYIVDSDTLDHGEYEYQLTAEDDGR